MTDYTEPSTIDVDEVMANIDQSFRIRAHQWTDEPVWPNVTVKALTDEVRRLRADAEHTDAYEAGYIAGQQAVAQRLHQVASEFEVDSL